MRRQINMFSSDDIIIITVYCENSIRTLFTRGDEFMVRLSQSPLDCTERRKADHFHDDEYVGDSLQ